MKTAKERYKAKCRAKRIILKASDEEINKLVDRLWPGLTDKQKEEFIEAGYEPPK